MDWGVKLFQNSAGAISFAIATEINLFQYLGLFIEIGSIALVCFLILVSLNVNKCKINLLRIHYELLFMKHDSCCCLLTGRTCKSLNNAL